MPLLREFFGEIMAKANRKAVSPKLMNKHFDDVLKVLDDMATSSFEIMPLFSASLRLSQKIVSMYKKAFNQGIMYAGK